VPDKHLNRVSRNETVRAEEKMFVRMMKLKIPRVWPIKTAAAFKTYKTADNSKHDMSYAVRLFPVVNGTLFVPKRRKLDFGIRVSCCSS